MKQFNVTEIKLFMVDKVDCVAFVFVCVTYGRLSNVVNW